MAKARRILKRAKAIGSIRTITKTMEMIATARFRRAHLRQMATKPFVDCLTDVVADVLRGGGLQDVDVPLLRPNASVRCRGMLVISSNRGLAGAYNSSVLRLASERLRTLRDSGQEVLLYCVGKRGINLLRFRKQPIEKAYTQFDRLPTFSQARELADVLIDQFAAGQISGLEVVYMQFLSSARQKPTIIQLLPLSDLTAGVPIEASPAQKPNYEFIPSAQEILRGLLPMVVRVRIYQCMLDAAASEQMMRMTAMRSATDSADDMIHDLTIKYNRTRQGQITTELAEIMGGRVGLEEG